MVISLVNTSAQKNILLNILLYLLKIKEYLTYLIYYLIEILEPSQLKLKTRILTLYPIFNIVLEIFANPIRKEKAITDNRN